MAEEVTERGWDPCTPWADSGAVWGPWQCSPCRVPGMYLRGPACAAFMMCVLVPSHAPPLLQFCRCFLMQMRCSEDHKEPPENTAYLQPRSQQCLNPISTPSMPHRGPMLVPAQEENPFSWRHCALPRSDLHGSDALAHPKPCTWSCLGGGDISGTSRLLSSSQAHELLLLGAPGHGWVPTPQTAWQQCRGGSPLESDWGAVL